MNIKPLTILKTGVSVSILAIVFTQVDWNQLKTQLGLLSLPFVAFIFFYYTACQWLSCLRWQIILKATGHRISIRQLLRYYFVGMFLNNFLPGAFGGDVYRIYQVAQTSNDAEVGLVSVFLERFSGLVALSGLAIFGLPFAFHLIARWDVILLFLICVAALVGAALLIASPQLLRWTAPGLARLGLSQLTQRFAKIQHLLRQFAHHPSALILSLGLSLALMLAIVYYHYLIAQQLHILVSYFELIVFIPIITVVTLLPISLGGLGIKEGLWIYLFSRVGISIEQALLLSLTMTGLALMISLPGGVILLMDALNQSPKHKRVETWKS
jgi:uncharacterized protein (TIRG00374 family)